MEVASLSPWERLYLAMQVGVQDPILLSTLSAEVRALLDAESLLTLAVLLAVSTVGAAWGGPVAWVAELGLAAAGLWYLGREAVAIVANFSSFTQLALGAKDDATLKKAGREFALGLGRLGSTLLAGLLTSGAFRAARATVAPRVKSWLATKQPTPKAEPVPNPKAEPLPSSKAEPAPAPKAEPVPKRPDAVERAKGALTTAAEVGLSRPVRDASIGAVLVPLAVLGALGVGGLLLASRKQEVQVRVVAT